MSTRQEFIGLAVGLLVCLVSSLCYAQEEWVARYNGPGNDNDGAYAIAVDGTGNVYVTGQSYGGDSTYNYYATIKYNSAGDTVWVRRYNGPGNDSDYACAIAVDGTGNVYVTGSSVGSGTADDYATIKYDSAGNTVWVRRYDGSVNNEDWASAIAVDGTGNVYVTGSSVGSGTSSYDYATIKYDSAGNTLWVRRYNGPDNDWDLARAIAVDGTGNVYVTGSIYGSGTYDDYATIKYNSAGDTLWVRRYNGPGNSVDWASAIAVDGTGNVYVTGSCVGSGTSDDYATIKYNSAGDTLWVGRYNGPGDDYARAIAVDGTGNVYVTGESSGSGTADDYATIKYLSVGVEERDCFTNARNDRLTIYPNPFRNKLSIKFQITKKSEIPDSQSEITLKVYDASGRMVRHFDHLTIQPFNRVVWFGDDYSGCKVPAGIYFVRLECGNYKTVEKTVLLQ